VFTPPDTPADRVAALRSALEATLRDEAFVAEANALQLDLKPMGWERVTAIVMDTINAPADVVEKAKAAIEPAK
jgi:tripartite-type tricarboxylate transporter receptor subunit TctC